jgi:oligopeptide/dipeptide ABC transporter ATP-binding protein
MAVGPAAAPAAPLLEVHELTTRFATPEGELRAVDRVSFRIPEGGAVGVVGESGSGKSVMALSLLKLVPDPPGRIVAGQVRLRGRDLLALRESEMRRLRGAEISMIFQDPMTSLNPVFTVGSQVGEALVLHRGMGRRQALAEAASLFRQVGIADPERRIGDYPHQLSGGMRQRVMIAMALACHPSLLIADEPTTALDVTIQAQILDLLAQLRRDLHMALLLITHDLGVVAESCEQVLVMYAGQIVESAPARQLFAQPRHPYTAGLLRSLASAGPRAQGAPRPRLQEIPGLVPRLDELPVGCRFQERCPRVQERCRREEPELEGLGEEGAARCFFPVEA